MKTVLLVSFISLAFAGCYSGGGSTTPAYSGDSNAAPGYSGTDSAKPAPPVGGVACTEEAKLCPDGKTSVGRNAANNCAFDPCPGEK